MSWLWALPSSPNPHTPLLRVTFQLQALLASVGAIPMHNSNLKHELDIHQRKKSHPKILPNTKILRTSFSEQLLLAA